MRKLKKLSRNLQHLAWLDAGACLVAITRDHAVTVLDASSGKVLHQERVRDHWAEFLAVHPDGRQFATADCLDARCRPASPAQLWELTPGGLTATPLPLDADLHGGLAFTPDGTALVGGAHCFSPAPRQFAGPMVWWDLHKGRPGTGFAGHAGLAGALTFTADGTLLVSTGGDDTVRVWDVANRKEIGNRKVRCLHRRLALAPDGRGLAIIHNYHGDFVLLDPSAGKKLGKPLEVNGHAPRSVSQLAYSPTSACLASVGGDGRLCFWDRDGTALAAHSPGTSQLDCVVFAPDGKSVAVSDGSGQIYLCGVP